MNEMATTTPAPLPAHAAAMRAALLDWYDRARRDLPWRARPGERADAYRVLVSEIMLQQTTVATVRSRYGPFLDRFPTAAALAAAPLEDVLHAWQGLGYYRRARALHACAVAVVERHGGRLPKELAALEDLPGLGPYTAAAVAAIAFGVPAVPVDGNVERVLSRIAGLARPLPQARPELRRLAGTLAGRERAGDLAQAVMELGALVCTPRRPACLTCPWRTWCAAAAMGTPEAFPVKPARTARPQRHALVFLLERGDGAFLFRRRPAEGLLGGMIELPGTPWTEAEPVPAGAIAAHAPGEARWRPVEGSVRHVFTHLELSLQLLRGSTRTAPQGIWARPDEFHALALPTLTKKLLRHAGLRWQGLHS